MCAGAVDRSTEVIETRFEVEYYMAHSQKTRELHDYCIAGLD